MNANNVYDSEKDILVLHDNEVKLLTQLCESPSFLFEEIIKNYLTDNGLDFSVKRQRLQDILMFYRNRVGSRTFFMISRECADKLLEIIHKLKLKGSKKIHSRQEQTDCIKFDSLEKVFCVFGDENAKLFRTEIVDQILTDGAQHNLRDDWKGKLKAVVSILQERRIINKINSSAILVNIFNTELAQLIQQSEADPLHPQALQQSKIREVNRIIVDRIRKQITKIDWVH